MNKDCVSLEVAQKLQKAGYKSECECWYIQKKVFGIEVWEIERDKTLIKIHQFGKIPAPTATQLAEELPNEINISFKNGKPRIHNNGLRFGKYPVDRNKWFCKYSNRSVREEIGFRTDTLPDALGLMMVYLLENKLI